MSTQPGLYPSTIARANGMCWDCLKVPAGGEGGTLRRCQKCTAKHRERGRIYSKLVRRHKRPYKAPKAIPFKPVLFTKERKILEAYRNLASKKIPQSVRTPAVSELSRRKAV